VLDLHWPGRVILGHDGEPIRCTSPARVLTLNSEARRLLWELRAELEPRLAEGADLAPVSGFASKLPGACARLALAFTMLRDPQAQEVGAEAMRASVAWAPFLLEHHRAVLGEAEVNDEVHHARRLWRALGRHGQPIMTARDMFKMVLDSALPNMATFQPVLDLLVEHEAVRLIPNAGGTVGRRPAQRFAVNPRLLPSTAKNLSDKSDKMNGVESELSDLSDNFQADHAQHGVVSHISIPCLESEMQDNEQVVVNGLDDSDSGE